MDLTRKKKILFHSNYANTASGFGGFMRELLPYLYKTGKYEIYLYAMGMNWRHPDFARFPWETYGTLPENPQELEMLNRDPNLGRLAYYGAHNIDKVIQTVKPDIIVQVEDFWAFGYAMDKPWWNKISCIVHWTAD